MKRLVGIAAVTAALSFGVVDRAGASNENAPQNDPTAHPHHRHTPDGECHEMAGPDAGGYHGGRHWGAVEGGQVHHGPCAAHP